MQGEVMFSAAWKGAAISAEVELRGRSVLLEPLRREHAEGLAMAGGAAEIWKYLTEPRGPFRQTSDAEVYVEHVLSHRAAGERVPFAIIARGTGQVVGCTSYFLETRWANRALEIGGTWLAPEVWRTAVNTECKYLLLCHAFEVLGADRVELMTDARNLRSQRAIERLGACREGTLRAHMLCPDGHRRDSVYYGVLAPEWAAIKQRLQAMLARESCA